MTFVPSSSETVARNDPPATLARLPSTVTVADDGTTDPCTSTWSSWTTVRSLGAAIVSRTGGGAGRGLPPHAVMTAALSVTVQRGARRMTEGRAVSGWHGDPGARRGRGPAEAAQAQRVGDDGQARQRHRRAGDHRVEQPDRGERDRRDVVAERPARGSAGSCAASRATGGSRRRRRAGRRRRA